MFVSQHARHAPVQSSSWTDLPNLVNEGEFQCIFQVCCPGSNSEYIEYRDQNAQYTLRARRSDVQDGHAAGV